MSTLTDSVRAMRRSARKRDGLVVALPEPDVTMTQDAEWCVVKTNGTWRQIRFHDYDQIFSVPGLYEKVIYDILQCQSPRVVGHLLQSALQEEDAPPDLMRVLDLGAGNGMVGEELAGLGAELIVGVDIVESAAAATERDRPDVYDNYHVVDMTSLAEAQSRKMTGYRFNTLTCVAALGFGDIPPEAFIAAYDFIRPGGWVAFNIKDDFLSSQDPSGFADLIRNMLRDGTLELRKEKAYQHRLGTDRTPLEYVAIVGKKRRNIAHCR